MNKSLFIYKIMYFINDYKNNDLKEDWIYSEIDWVKLFIQLVKEY